jgi:hypothetical protein
VQELHVVAHGRLREFEFGGEATDQRTSVGALLDQSEDAHPASGR